jgi:hypothetical protein
MVVIVFVILHENVGERPGNGGRGEQDKHNQVSGNAESLILVVITRNAFLFNSVSASSGVKRVDTFLVGGRHILSFFYAFFDRRPKEI